MRVDALNMTKVNKYSNTNNKCYNLQNKRNII